MKSADMPARQAVVAIAVVLLIAICPRMGLAAGETSIEFGEEWESRMGDSPVDAEGRLLWTRADFDSPEWQPETWKEKEGEEHFLWYRAALPRGEWRDPAILISQVAMAFEVYLEEDLIYRAGEMKKAYGNKFQIMNWYLVPLPEGFQGKRLYVRIFSNDPTFIGMVSPPVLGNMFDHVTSILQKSLSRVVIGCILTLMGLFGFYIYAKREERIVLSFSILSFCVGLFTAAGAGMHQLLVDAPLFWWYLNFVPFFLFSVGLWAFLEQLFSDNRCHILSRRMWQVFALYALVALVLDATNLVIMITLSNIYMLLLMVGIVISVILMFKAPERASAEFKVLNVGIGILMASGFHDILRGLKVLPGPADLFLFHWGVFIFILFLAYIIEHRFAAAHESLQVYSWELEDRVTERTKDLQEKNGQLEETLDELGETQNRLVMREKMASLGNLVAGVAHEVNNPIGAVNSAADVASRCIDRLMNSLESNSGWKELEEDRPFQQAVSLLRENVRLIGTASERIVGIVRSLRNFARLDEAEFQQADLHEGLDSTLMLVHHELKDRVEVVKEYGEIPPIKCYPNQLNQVFMNLLVNAAHAIEGKGRITIQTWAENDHVRVQIADTGRGIEAQHLERIFDPGFTTKGVGVGTGLGLSICYSIVEKHGGEIAVESAPGEGTVFILKLPIRAAA